MLLVQINITFLKYYVKSAKPEGADYSTLRDQPFYFIVAIAEIMYTSFAFLYF